MTLFRLSYFSRLALDLGASTLRHELRDILKASRTNNAAAGITCALMFDRAWFLQVLEGDRAAVSDAFLRIARDPRHADIRIIEATAAAERRFAGWSMAFADASGDMSALLLRYGPSAAFQPDALAPPAALDLLAAATAATDGQAAA